MFKYLMLLVHTLTDFIFQSNSTVENKRNLKLNGFFIHILTLTLFSFLTNFFNTNMAGA